jgi:hypothetical protein
LLFEVAVGDFDDRMKALPFLRKEDFEEWFNGTGQIPDKWRKYYEPQAFDDAGGRYGRDICGRHDG